MDFHGTNSTNWSAKAQVLICELAGFGTHIGWHSSQMCPMLGCLHGDGSHASTEIQQFLPRAQLREVEHQASCGKTWAKSTQNVPNCWASWTFWGAINIWNHLWLPSFLGHFQKENSSNLLQQQNKQQCFQDSIDLPGFPHSSSQHHQMNQWCFHHLSPFHIHGRSQSRRRKCLASVRCQGRFSRGSREGFVAPRREAPKVAQEMPKVTWAATLFRFQVVKWGDYRRS